MEFIAHNLAPIMFAGLIAFLLVGFPVAFSLGACGLFFAFLGIELNVLPEALLQAFMTLQKKIEGQHLTGEGHPRHLDAEAQGEFPVPVQGAHDLEPTANKGVWTVPTIIR